MNETAERLSKAFAIQKFPPSCLGQRDELLQCYKQNSDRTLLCSDVVKNFSRCVHSTRLVSHLYAHQLKLVILGGLFHMDAPFVIFSLLQPNYSFLQKDLVNGKLYLDFRSFRFLNVQ